MRWIGLLSALVLSAAAAAQGWQREVDALIARHYPGLVRMEVRDSMMHALYYPERGSTVVKQKRSEFAQDHPLYVRDDVPENDVVLIRTQLTEDDESTHYVVFTEGASADPEFYLVSGTEHMPLHFGATIMVIPGDGTVLTFGRHNSLFVQRHLFRIADGKPVEARQPLHYVGLQSVAMAKLTIRSEPLGEMLAELAPGDPVEVLAAHLSEEGKWFLVKTPPGLLGWVELEAVQENPAIKGMEWVGD